MDKEEKKKEKIEKGVNRMEEMKKKCMNKKIDKESEMNVKEKVLLRRIIYSEEDDEIDEIEKKRKKNEEIGIIGEIIGIK